MHIHLGAMDFLVFVAYFLVFAFMWRSTAAILHDRPIGQAMSFFL